jgi:hypothetical protein
LRSRLGERCVAEKIVKYGDGVPCRKCGAHGACSAFRGFQQEIGVQPPMGACRFATRPATTPSGPPRPKPTEGLENRG